MTQTSELVIATWNLEWAPAQSARGGEMRALLTASNADVICVTEAHADNLPEGGDLIESGADYGYPLREGRRKVILWTKHNWDQRDPRGSELLPPGRFAAGTLHLDAATIRVVGVCIPWSAAHVTSGRRDRTQWEDHLSYLTGLGVYLGQAEPLPTILLGDFNQAIPRFRQPLEVERRLKTEVLDRGYQPLTRGLAGSDDQPLIDHICVSPGLSGEVTELLPKKKAGYRLTDHTGVVAKLRFNASLENDELRLTS